MQSRTIMQSKPTEKDTTIKVPVDLKGDLDAIKVDSQETYAGVIRRLVEGRIPFESTEDTVNIAIPRKVYRMMVMVLPPNIGDQVRKGVR
jgi:hypothetical protein